MPGISGEAGEITVQATDLDRVDAPRAGEDAPGGGGALRLDREELCAADGLVPPGRAQSQREAITVGTVGRAWRALVEAVGELLDGRQRLWALEAGAGTRTLFDLPEDAYIVGVDRDLHALEVNARLDQRVPVDLVDYRPQSAGFDLISCWYVLDELADPATVLDRFADWTAPGGLVVLGVPNLRSVRGLWARLRGRAKLRRPLTPTALRQRFDEHGFTPVFQVFYEDSDQISVRRRLRITHGRWNALQAVVRVLSLGFVDAARTDYLVVFRRDE